MIYFLLLSQILLLWSHRFRFQLLRLIWLSFGVEWSVIYSTTNHFDMTILLISMIKTWLSLRHYLWWKRTTSIARFRSSSIMPTFDLLLWIEVIYLIVILNTRSIHLILLEFILRLSELSSWSLKFKVWLITLLLVTLNFTLAHILWGILNFIWV